MSRIEKSKTLWKQRITLLMVMIFCGLISGTEYIPQDDSAQLIKKELSSEADQNSENETFLTIAVDAVVPFVTTLSQQIFYLIYETVSLEENSTFKVPTSIVLVNQFWEILFERIISPNAP
jgi:hypothetical protein